MKEYRKKEEERKKSSCTGAVRVKGLTQGHKNGGNEGGASSILLFHLPQTDLSCPSRGLNSRPSGYTLASLTFNNPLAFIPYNIFFSFCCCPNSCRLK